MDHYSVNVKCPFYLREEPKVIVCEGIGSAASLRLAFRSAKQKRRHEEQYCAGIDDCRACPLYGAIETKYT